MKALNPIEIVILQFRYNDRLKDKIRVKFSLYSSLIPYFVRILCGNK